MGYKIYGLKDTEDGVECVHFYTTKEPFGLAGSLRIHNGFICRYSYNGTNEEEKAIAVIDANGVIQEI